MYISEENSSLFLSIDPTTLRASSKHELHVNIPSVRKVMVEERSICYREWLYQYNPTYYLILLPAYHSSKGKRSSRRYENRFFLAIPLRFRASFWARGKIHKFAFPPKPNFATQNHDKRPWPCPPSQKIGPTALDYEAASYPSCEVFDIRPPIHVSSSPLKNLPRCL